MVNCKPMSIPDGQFARLSRPDSWDFKRIGSVNLVRQMPFQLSQLRGKFALLFFGYTSCPDGNKDLIKDSQCFNLSCLSCPISKLGGEGQKDYVVYRE